MSKIIFLVLLPLLVSSTGYKSCPRQIAIDHIGEYNNKPLANIIFSTQPVDIGNRDFIATARIILSDEEFSFIETAIKDFDQIVPVNKNSKDIDYGTYKVEILDGCKPARERYFNRLQSITFLQYLLKVLAQHKPSLRNKIVENSNIRGALNGLDY